MPSIRQIALDWNCARSYVQRCVKRGCSTESFEAARLWRMANTQRARNSPGKLEEPAVDTEELIEKTSPMGDTLKRPKKGESLEHALKGIKLAVNESEDELRRSLIEGKPQKVGAWIALHTRAVEALVKLEVLIRTELERQKVLIPLTEAQSITRKVLGVIVSRLNALPQNVAARCDLTDPQMTMTVLQDESAGILEDE